MLFFLQKNKPRIVILDVAGARRRRWRRCSIAATCADVAAAAALWRSVVTADVVTSLYIVLLLRQFAFEYELLQVSFVLHSLNR